MKTVKVVKTLFFLLLAALLSVTLVRIYGFNDNVHSQSVFDDFYSLEDQTVDVVWIGPSSVREYLIPSEAFDYNGVSIYGLSTGNQPFSATRYLIEEARKTQSPKVFLVDVRQLAYSDPTPLEAIQRVTGNMRWSETRSKAIEELSNVVEETNPQETIDLLSLYFDFLAFHSRRDINSADFGYDPQSFLGFSIYPSVKAFDKTDVQGRMGTKPSPIDENSNRFLNEFLDWCDSSNVNVVFTSTPHVLSAEYFAKYNYVKDKVESRGYQYLDLNTAADAIGLDYAKDFKNEEHVNVYGAEKVTRWAADYLQKKYDLADHRHDEGYEAFATAHNDYKAALAELDNPQKK